MKTGQRTSLQAQQLILQCLADEANIELIFSARCWHDYKKINLWTSRIQEGDQVEFGGAQPINISRILEISVRANRRGSGIIFGVADRAAHKAVRILKQMVPWDALAIFQFSEPVKSGNTYRFTLLGGWDGRQRT